MTEVYLFGAAIVDALARPVSAEVFQRSSVAAEAIALTVGGDALNEATVLAQLGHAPALRTTLGNDRAAGLVRDHCARAGILLDAKTLDAPTGVNLVLVDAAGERHFVTDPRSCLRRLSLDDALPALGTEAFREARIATLASMFVSPEMDIADMTALMRRCRQAGKLTCADATHAKNGETARQLSPLLQELDWFFPNREEAALLTGCDAPGDIAKALMDNGARGIALKLGGDGCLVADADGMTLVPAVPNIRAIDTTGAGDTFAAAFQAALLEGNDAVRAAAFANAAASICVEHTGATGAGMKGMEIEKRMRISARNSELRINGVGRRSGLS